MGVIFLIALACADRRETQLQRFLLRGNDMAAKQNFSEARRFYGEAIRLDSCFADAWNNLGTVQFKERHFREAMASYTRAIDCNPAFYDALLHRANTYYELNDPGSALRDLREYGEHYPDTSILFFSSALAFTRMARYDTAETLFREALRRDPENNEIRVNLGIVYYLKDEFDSARTILHNSIARDASEANAYNTLALIAAASGQPDEALSWIDKALAVRPADAWFLNNRGYFYLLKGDLSRAVRDVDASIMEDPYNAWAYRNKGIYYLEKDDPVSSLRVLNHALRLDSTVELLYFYLGKASIRNGEKQKGCVYLSKALRKDDINAAEYARHCPR